LAKNCSATASDVPFDGVWQAIGDPALVYPAVLTLKIAAATLMLGGNIAGKTNTVSLGLHNAVFNGEFPRVFVLSSILGLAAVTVFFVLQRLSRSRLSLKKSCRWRTGSRHERADRPAATVVTAPT
jgi:ABC-type sulfate transport system permease subunit